MALTKKDKETILDCIECESFDYAFYGYSDFAQIKDKKFHELRKAFLEARKALSEYIGDEDGD